MNTVVDAKWKIQKQTLIEDFYDLARPALYSSQEVAALLSQKYTCIERQKIEDACRQYRQNRYTKLEEIISELVKLS